MGADADVDANANVDTDVERLSSILESSGNIVFFGGAGVSTESGIPDFRSAGGLYNGGAGGVGGVGSVGGAVGKIGASKYSIPPEKLLSHSFFLSHKIEFFEYYKQNILHLDAQPNPAHIKLAELERSGKLRAVITQNIDGLHQKAGSINVIELHGSVYRNNCVRCGKSYDANYIANACGVPVCECLGVIKPGVVLYEESLNQDDIECAIDYISAADVLIIGGTSLVVYPAAGLVRYYRGSKLIIINKSTTDSDDSALLVIRKSIGEVFSKIKINK